MIWNYDNFSRQNVKSNRIYTVLNNNIYSKGVLKNHEINRGNYKYFKKHVAKNILLMKKSKCPQRAHLWLSPLSPLVHLIMLHPT
jgi:hypothetical protein